MPCFASFNNLILSVRDSLEWCLRKSRAPESFFLRRALSYLRFHPCSTTASPDRKTGLPGRYHDFQSRIFELDNLLSHHATSSAEVIAALNDLRAFAPAPHVEIVEPELWGFLALVVQTHLKKSTFADAVSNLNAAGRTLSPEDENYLRLLLRHHCGWSATYPEHMNDAWVEFFRNNYPHIKGLVPILDSLTYPEELRSLPDGMQPARPEFFLLANAEYYYVYDFTDGGCGLIRAGKTLKDVFIGMKECTYLGFGWDESVWEYEDRRGDLDENDYLPIYYREKSGSFGRMRFEDRNIL